MQNHPDYPNQPEIAPLSSILFDSVRRLWAAPTPQPKLRVRQVEDHGSLTQQMEKLTVQQLGTALRMRGVYGDDEKVLSSLEHMALAGEMNFEEFATRVKNLYPKTYEDLDVTLRMKIAAMIVPDAN